MKVKIGPFPNRWVSDVFTHYMNRKYGYVDWPKDYTLFERVLEKFESLLQSVYNYTINLFLDRREQQIDIRIDYWDTWSMDYTLAPIILPMLKQLKENKHGAPDVDPEDVPEELRATTEEYHQYKREGETDPKFFERWDWVMDQMIYSFEYKVKKDDLFMYFDPHEEYDEMQAEQERISNGFRLFGKYYEALWD